MNPNLLKDSGLQEQASAALAALGLDATEAQLALTAAKMRTGLSAAAQKSEVLRLVGLEVVAEAMAEFLTWAAVRQGKVNDEEWQKRLVEGAKTVERLVREKSEQLVAGLLSVKNSKD